MKHVFRFLGTRTDGSWLLSDDERHHALTVCKVEVGDHFELADGKGWTAEATVLDKAKRHFDYQVLSENYTEQTPRPVTLVCGLLKPGVIDEILPFLVELNAHQIIFFAKSRKDISRYNEKVQGRWARICKEAFKQCKRPFLPHVKIVEDMSAALSEVAKCQKFILDEHSSQNLSNFQFDPVAPTAFLIGSEMGFSAEEKKLAEDAQFMPIRIGNHILRARTAIVATLAIVEHALL